MVDGDTVFLDVVVLSRVMGAREFGEPGTDACMEEADLDDGLPAGVAVAGLDGRERVDDVEDELGGFEDTFFGFLAGEVTRGVEYFGNLWDGEAASEGEVEEGV